MHLSKIVPEWKYTVFLLSIVVISDQVVTKTAGNQFVWGMKITQYNTNTSITISVEGKGLRSNTLEYLDYFFNLMSNIMRLVRSYQLFGYVSTKVIR